MNRINFAPEEFYHLYNRGTEKRDIFLDTQDYDRFLSLLYLSNSSERVDIKLQGRTLEKILLIDRNDILLDIVAYCLMPNHFHLLIKVREENVVGKFMQKMLTAYTMYFNKKYERTGSLFQGKFKSSHVGDDRYLKYLFAYIHLNPVKLIDPPWKENGITDKDAAEKFLQKFKYSSFLDYTQTYKRLPHKIINPEILPAYAENEKDFERMVFEWLSYTKE